MLRNNYSLQSAVRSKHFMHPVDMGDALATLKEFIFTMYS